MKRRRLPRAPNRPIQSTLLALVLAGAAGSLPAQNPGWKSTGPNCSPILALAFAGADSKRAYAATITEPATLFVSNDNGASWSPTERQPRTREPILGIDVDPTNDRVLWVAAEGVFRSTDRGRSWEKRNDGLPQPLSVWDLEVHPADPNVVHAIAHARLYQTTDGGRRWRQISTNDFVIDYAVDPRDPDRVWVSIFGGVLRTTSGGRSWGAASDGLNDGGPLALDPTAPSTLYTAVRGYVYRTTNGRRWERLGAIGDECCSDDAAFVSIDPSRPSRLLLGLERGSSHEAALWRSTDSGASWKPLGLVGETLTRIARHPGKPRIVLIGSSDSLYRSRKDGKRPAQSQTGLFGGRVDELAVVPPLATAATKPITYGANRCGLYSRVHQQDAWTLVERDDWYSTGALAVSTADPRLLYRGMRRTLDRFESIDVSLDGGRTWEIATFWNNGSEAVEIQVSPADPMRVYAAAGDIGLYVSDDGGVTWRSPVEGPTAGLVPRVIVPHPTEPDTVFVSFGGVLRSTNGGVSWEPIADFGVRDLAIVPGETETIWAVVGDELRRSRNGGASWKGVAVDLPSRAELHSVVVDTANGGTVYLGHTSGVLRSTNDGRTWNRFDRGLPRGLEIRTTPHRRLELTSKGELLLATDRGVYVTRAR